MNAADAICGGEIGDGAGDLQHAVVGACRQFQTLGRLPQQGLPRLVKLRGFLQHPSVCLCIRTRGRTRVTVRLTFAGRSDPRCHLPTSLGRRWQRKIRC